MKNHPDNFEFYGIGWSKKLRPLYFSLLEQYLPGDLKKLMFMTDIFLPENILYKGQVVSKNKILKNISFLSVMKMLRTCLVGLQKKYLIVFQLGQFLFTGVLPMCKI